MTEGRPCCSPARIRDDAQKLDAPAAPVERHGAPAHHDQVMVPAGRFRMGSIGPETLPGDGEGPVRDVHVSSFLIDSTCVTKRQFSTFVEETAYVTDAQTFGWSYVFARALPSGAVTRGSVARTPWWLGVDGAYWACPEGPGSTWEERMDHPAVHISWRDAQAYAVWAGLRLPTESEWEKAARGELVGALYPWGDELYPEGQTRANIWQGDFPSKSIALDGYVGTVPVNSYSPNAVGLYNMAGNVWEWTHDRWSAGWHAPARLETRIDPQGPASGADRVIRGGSYLCHHSYCTRYRVSARSHNSPDSTTAHMGFRCAKSL